MKRKTDKDVRKTNKDVRGSPQPWGYVHQKGVTSRDIRFN